MQLNRSTDMALRVAMLAAADPRRMTVDQLAGQLRLPRNHVAKLVQRLRRLGVPVTTRDRSGGVAFAEGGALSFTGEATRARRENLLLFASDYEQPFGTFTGELPGAGPLREGLGVMERHTAKW